MIRVLVGGSCLGVCGRSTSISHLWTPHPMNSFFQDFPSSDAKWCNQSPMARDNSYATVYYPPGNESQHIPPFAKVGKSIHRLTKKSRKGKPVGDMKSFREGTLPKALIALGTPGNRPKIPETWLIWSNFLWFSGAEHVSFREGEKKI